MTRRWKSTSTTIRRNRWPLLRRRLKSVRVELQPSLSALQEAGNLAHGNARVRREVEDLRQICKWIKQVLKAQSWQPREASLSPSSPATPRAWMRWNEEM